MTDKTKPRVFISMPMSGLTKDEIIKRMACEKANIEAMLMDEVELIDTHINNADIPDGVDAGLWCLGESIKLLASADLIYFSYGYDKARGCMIEYQCAMAYGVECINVSNKA